MPNALPLPAAPRPFALAAVVVLHLLLIAAWLGARWAVTTPAERVGTLVWILPPAAPLPAAAAAVPRTAIARQPAPARAAAPTPAPSTHAPTLTLAAPAAPPAPEPAPSQPRERLLDGEATRHAIRAAGRQPLLAERAEAATGIAIASQGERFSEAAAKAGKGDCLKGEFAYGGGGLLSLPALAYAAATGTCAK